jgi:hypothetical protein
MRRHPIRNSNDDVEKPVRSHVSRRSCHRIRAIQERGDDKFHFLPITVFEQNVPVDQCQPGNLTCHLQNLGKRNQIDRFVEGTWLLFLP